MARHFRAAPENGGGEGCISTRLTISPEQTNDARVRCAPAAAEQATSSTIGDSVRRKEEQAMSYP
jgi:hypothetical protein